MVEFTAVEQNKEKRMKSNEDSLRDLWDNIKCNNIHTLGVPEGAKREKGPEKIFEEIIVENFKYFLWCFLSLFSFWNPCNVNVGVFYVVPEVSLAVFLFFFLFLA